MMRRAVLLLAAMLVGAAITATTASAQTFNNDDDYAALCIPLTLSSSTVKPGDTINDAPAGLGSVRRFGLSAYTIVVDVPPGGTVTVALQLTGAIARSRDYQLTVVRQPTVNSDHIDVTLNGSEGWRVAAFPGFQLAGPAGKASIGTGRTEILTARLDNG